MSAIHHGEIVVCRRIKRHVGFGLRQPIAALDDDSCGTSKRLELRGQAIAIRDHISRRFAPLVVKNANPLGRPAIGAACTAVKMLMVQTRVCRLSLYSANGCMAVAVPHCRKPVARSSGGSLLSPNKSARMLPEGRNGRDRGRGRRSTRLTISSAAAAATPQG
jgi:hypothetical protein